MKTLVIDPGHGGKDYGATNKRTGHKEKDIVLSICLMMRDLLKGHFRIVMTRENDRFLELHERAAIANKHGAPLFSLHANSGGGTGYECFTTPGQTKSDPWATQALGSYGVAIPSLRLRPGLGDGDPDKEAKFAVLRRTRAEAILFELGFIDKNSEAYLMGSDSFQLSAARALAESCVIHFLNEPLISKPPIDEENNSEGDSDFVRIPRTILKSLIWQNDKIKPYL